MRNRIHAFNWYQFQSPWTTVINAPLCRISLSSRAGCVKVNEMATLTGTEIVPDSCDVYDVHKLVGSPREGLLCVKTAIFLGLCAVRSRKMTARCVGDSWVFCCSLSAVMVVHCVVWTEWVCCSLSVGLNLESCDHLIGKVKLSLNFSEVYWLRAFQLSWTRPARFVDVQSFVTASRHVCHSFSTE